MNAKRQDIMRQVINLGVFLFTIVLNVMANLLPLGGRNTGEISDALPSYFTPAGFTFSVWSIIYLGLIGFIGYQLLSKQRDNIYLRRIGYWPAVANGLNGLWIVAWHFAYYWLSVLLMISLLASLFVVYYRLNVEAPIAERRGRSWMDSLLIVFPFSIYFAWINVATVANIASVANYAGWNGFGIAEPTWSMLIIGVVALIGFLLSISRSNLPYAAVLVWALIGVQANQPASVGTTAIVAAVLIGGAALIGWYRFGAMRPRVSQTA